LEHGGAPRGGPRQPAPPSPAASCADRPPRAQGSAVLFANRAAAHLAAGVPRGPQPKVTGSRVANLYRQSMRWEALEPLGRSLGRPTEALVDATAAIAEQPGYPRGHYRHARALLELGRTGTLAPACLRIARATAPGG
jgi:hypothetical protein